MMSFLDEAVAGSLKFMPKRLVGRVARQYIAGETLAEAVEETRRLNESGCRVTMDLLGESVVNEGDARAAAATYVTMLDAIADGGLDATISVKPTGTGLAFGVDTFLENLRPVLDRARQHGNRVRIDMEDSSTTDDTLAAYRQLRAEGYDNVGVVLQAMLLRTLDDLKALQDLTPSIRICKGIYVEPPELAHQSRVGVNDSFKALLDHSLASRDFSIGIATHDDVIIEHAESVIAERGLSPDDYEFQMLLGVRPELRRQLLDRGHRVRIYVPYGKAWYAYSVRRLRENPKVAGYVTKDVLKDPRILFGGSDR
jgi:proline dehydrogenase